jgi:hypothetical protein
LRSPLRKAKVCKDCRSQLKKKKKKIKINKTVILLVVLYGFETWSLTLREEQRLSFFENRVLRKIFGPKRDEDGAGHVACMGKGRGAYGVLVGRPEGKRPLGRPRCR